METASLVTLTVTMQIPAKDVLEAVQSLCLFNPHGHDETPENDFVRCLTHTRSMSGENPRQGGFFGPMVNALEAMHPEAIAAHRRWEAARAKLPWNLLCFLECKDETYWHPYQHAWHPYQPKTGKWSAHMSLWFPRTPEGRDTLKRYPMTLSPSDWRAARDAYSLNPVVFAREYAHPLAEAAALAAKQQEPGSKNHLIVARYAEWLHDVAALMEASAESPKERADLAVTLDGDSVISRKYAPVL